MVEGSGGGGARPESRPAAKPASSCESAGGRLRFTVDIRAGETTIVSWKKLLREANQSKSDRPGPANLGPEAQRRPVSDAAKLEALNEEEEEDEAAQVQAGPNRLSNVIERIERMYAGNGSGDEEDVVLDNVPDDDEYDTEDSFIDDTELDDYFKVDNSEIKHDGFFINRGKLESVEPTISANQAPKKRQRKDFTKGHSESDDGHKPTKIVKIGNKGKKALSSTQRTSASQSPRVALPNIHGEDMNQAASANAAKVSIKKKFADPRTTEDLSGLLNGDAIRQDTDTDGQKLGVLSSKNHSSKCKETTGLRDTKAHRSNLKSSYTSKSQSGKQQNSGDALGQSSQQKEKGGTVERFDLNVPAGTARDSSPTMAACMPRKEGSSVRPKSTALEKAIRELEHIVTESRPPSTEVQDPELAQVVKKRLPPEIKQKLAKVARLAHGIHGKIPMDLINRLMGIVGHLMSIRTLKRNLKLMANMGLSAKQEKDDRIEKIKQEVAEMVKLRVPHMKSKAEQQSANSDDFQEAGPEEKEALKRKYSMDDVLGNKICDLYDLYVERTEEDSGPPVKKLYQELVLLWPSGFMDADGIKRAIFRAKDRRRLSSVRKDRDQIKKNKALPPKADQAMHIREKSAADSRPTSTSKPVVSAGRSPIASANGINLNKPKPKQEKSKKSPGDNPVNMTPSNVLPKKKLKKKPNPEAFDAQFRLEKHQKHVGGTSGS